ncbi:MAG: phytanoyl-CoA dioxygenase family protein [Planctomycetota bacterium]
MQFCSARKREHFPGDSTYFSGLDHDAVISNLRRDGFTVLGKLFDATTVARILDSVKGLKAYDYLVDKDKLFNVDQLPDGVRTAMFRREDLAEVDEITKIANDPKLLSVVQDYLGAAPLLSNILMWWSYPAGSAIGPQHFHRDVDDFRFLKLFVYLTDVDENRGPHVCVKTSHTDSDAGMRELRRYQDDEIFGRYGNDAVTTIVGTAGTALLSDSFGFHKGTPPSTGTRLLLQFQWSLLPIGIENYQPTQRQPAYPYDREVNRLLIAK